METELVRSTAAEMAIRGMPRAHAQQAARELVAAAKQASVRNGMLDLPPTMGDVMLREPSNEYLVALVSRLRQEGVREDDIRWWWNRYDLERQVMILTDHTHALAEIFRLEDEGMSRELAMERVERIRPKWGVVEASTPPLGPDDCLPWELLRRVGLWTAENLARPDVKDAITQASSVNAFLREQMKAGAF